MTDVSYSVDSKLAPLLIALVLLSVFAWIGWQIYLSVIKIQRGAEERMARHNVNFNRKGGGLRVGVRDRGEESYVDATQDWVVKAWNMAGTGAEKAKQAVKRK